MRTPPGFVPWLPRMAAALAAGAAVSTLLLARRQTRRGVPRRVALQRAAGWSGAVASTAGILVVTLTPTDGIHLGVNLVPLAGTREVLRVSGDPAVVARIVSLNVLLFVPLGASLGLLLPANRLVGAALAGGCLSALVETAQLLLPITRSPDVDDVLLNTVGAVLGAGLAGTLVRRLDGTGSPG